MKADFITTYSKIKFTPLMPKIEDINITDIGHALSLICRANGHFKHFYSVAQHCINCAIEAKERGLSKKVQLACLLHDASEAYISDVTRPVKKHIPNYIEIEKTLQNEINKKYSIDNLTKEEYSKLCEIDDAMLYYEFLEIMGEQVFSYKPKLFSKPNLEQQEFKIVENQFINIFNKLTDQKKGYLSVGIDVCKGKWLVVALKEDSFEVDKFNNISDVCKKYRDADSIMIDIPIGLAENKDDIRPDKELRKLLKGKSSSVFNTPCRQAVYSESYNEAARENIRVLGLSISKQSYGISKKIREIDAFISENTVWKNRLVESHPEYCFKILNDGRPIIENKLKPEGQEKRLSVLTKYYTNAPEVIKKYISDVPSRKKIDDVIDAMCLAIIGIQGLENGFITVPNEPSIDKRGIKMQIVAANI